jgi:uncharacterized membrane-anchored protein
MLAAVLAQTITDTVDNSMTWLESTGKTALGVVIIFLIIAALVTAKSTTAIIKVGIRVVLAVALVGGLAVWLSGAFTNDVKSKGGSMPAPVVVVEPRVGV